MRIRRIGQLTRRSTDRALNRAGSSGVAHVDKVLAAATAPASGFELNREAEMVALFRFVGARDGVTVRKISVAQSVFARLVAAKAAIAVGTVVLLGGGVAFAASTGRLPEVLGGDHRSPTGAAHSSQAPGQQGTKGPNGPNGPNGPKATSSANPTPRTPSATPTPSPRGLCRAFQAQSASNPGKALNNPAFTTLATAAGGKANMSAFCVNLIGAPAPKPTNAPTSQPTHPVPPAPPTKAPNPHKPTKSPGSKVVTPSSDESSQ